MGCKAFEKLKNGGGTSYRLCQEGLPLLFPHIGKRVVDVDLETFKLLISNSSVKHAELSEDFAKALEVLGQGIAVLRLTHGESTDVAVGYNFPKSFGLMCPKETIEAFKIIYG